MTDRWSTEENGKIGTPKGLYTPKSDDLMKELKEAAKYAGYKSFKVFVDGNEVVKPSSLQTNSIAALNAPVRIEPYDKAA